MFRYDNGQFRNNPPAMVVLDGFRRNFTDLTREQWDGLGYNEAVPVRRAPFTTYETRWVKGEDLIFREEIMAATVDEEARTAHEAVEIRTERDRLLRDSDWTQLADSTLDETALVLWQSYRQALRDVPQQTGFPFAVHWPTRPEDE